MQSKTTYLRHHSRKLARGFTLIELLIVMVILGLLASLVGPRLFGQLDASKIKAARTQIEMVGAALDTYRLDMSRYPKTDEGIAALFEKPSDPAQATRWRGPYLKKRVDKDPWGNSYVYKAPGEKAEYELSSLGADGQEGGTGDGADIHSWE
jgi:general secretion pathway protein G